MLIIRVVRFRTLKFQPRIVTSFRPHGKWGDLLVCLIPTMWCINILINSTFLLKLIEWQNETSLFTIRIRGKQWYWIYKFDVKDIADILSIGKNVGHDKFFFPTPNALDNLDDYLRLIQLRASNAWLKKYWDVSLKLQARENYEHLVASSDQIPMIPTYKNKKIDFKLSYADNFLKFQKKQIKAAGLHDFINETGRVGANKYLFNAAENPDKYHRIKSLPILSDGKIEYWGTGIHSAEEHLIKAYRHTYTFYVHETFYDHFLTYRDRYSRYLFPNKYISANFNIRDKAEPFSKTLIRFFRNQDDLARLSQLDQKYFDAALFYDFDEYEKDYRKYSFVKQYRESRETGEFILIRSFFDKNQRKRSIASRFEDLQKRVGNIKKYNTHLLFYGHPGIYDDSIYSTVNPTNYYVPIKKSINFDEGLRWIKRGFGTNEPLKLIKVSYDKGEGFLFKTRYATNDTAMHKNVTYNPYLVIKQKRYTLKKKILEKNFKTHNKNFIPNKNKIVISKSNFFLKNNVTTETYDNLTRLYKFFKKNKKRDEMFSVVTARRLLRTKRTLVLPAHVNITAITNSYDVVHSWFIPGLGLKLDCIPGRATHHTFYADNVGFYYGQCAEICGRYHHHMPIRLCILPYDQFLVWWHHFGLPKLMYSGKNRVHANNFYFRKYVW